MRVLTLSEFQDWHRKEMPREYIFASDNQPVSEQSGLRVSLHFRDLFVCPELCQICLTENKRCSLFFDRVKEVHMFDDGNSIGMIIEVLCGEQGSRLYRILAD